jgi:hypothetical protein
MPQQQIAMYVHLHWAYNRPYAARRWTVDDWRDYALGLRSLGYNALMLWPMSETMSDPLTASDVAFLEKIRQVIKILHREVGFTIWVVLTPNTVSNEKAAQYPFEERPFFLTETRLNPGDPEAVDELIRRRRLIFPYLREADGICIIDSDPGGYAGSRNADFARLLGRYMDVWTEYNPSGKTCYWMHYGWETVSRYWEMLEKHGQKVELIWDKRNYGEIIQYLIDSRRENWYLCGGYDIHNQVIEEMQVGSRSLYFRYGIVEAEPSFPLTNYHPQQVADDVGKHKTLSSSLGLMANAQTHLVQLPHTYLFSHFAQGKAMSEIDITGFARGLIPETGELLAESWQALWPGDDTGKMGELAQRLTAQVNGPFSTGPHSKLLLGGAKRYLEDLAAQLVFRAATIEAIQVLQEKSNPRMQLGVLLTTWSNWQNRTGFADAFWDNQGILAALEKVNDPEMEAVLRGFISLLNPAGRHGMVLKILQALRRYLQNTG